MSSHKLQFEKTRIEGRLRKLEQMLIEEGDCVAIWKEYHHSQSAYHTLRLKEYTQRKNKDAYK